MDIVRIPKTLCDDINSMMTRYWWGQTKNEKKIHLIKWDKLCAPKNKGRMNFHDLRCFNTAMLAKQAWRLIHDTYSLFYWVYKAQYFPSCSFMEAELGSNPSYVSRSLLSAREVIQEGSKWRVGHGQYIEVERHKWLPRPVIPTGVLPPSQRVCDLINDSTRQWDRGKIHTLFAPSTRQEILALPLQSPTRRDFLEWQESKARIFSV